MTGQVDPESAPGRTSAPPVVTIFGSYGAGAEQVGRAVAERLRLPYHRQAFSSEAIEGGEVGHHEAEFLRKMIHVLAATFGTTAEPDEETGALVEELLTENRRQVQTCAQLGGVVIGRNAALLLADRERTLHVMLTGDVQDRIARAAAEGGLTREHAAARLEREDELRADMSLAIHGWDPRRPDAYDLVANTSRVPLDAVADAIVASVAVMAD